MEYPNFNNYFPHIPYDTQIILMNEIWETLNIKQNALIESPTGI